MAEAGEQIVYGGPDLPDVDVWVEDDFGGQWVPGELLRSVKLEDGRWRHLVRWWPIADRPPREQVVGEARVRRDDPLRYDDL